MLYDIDLAWADGRGLGPERVTDQYVEFPSRFRWFRPGNPERAITHVFVGFGGIRPRKRGGISFVKAQHVLLET